MTDGVEIISLPGSLKYKAPKFIGLVVLLNKFTNLSIRVLNGIEPSYGMSNMVSLSNITLEPT